MGQSVCACMFMCLSLFPLGTSLTLNQTFPVHLCFIHFIFFVPSPNFSIIPECVLIHFELLSKANQPSLWFFLILNSNMRAERGTTFNVTPLLQVISKPRGMESHVSYLLLSYLLGRQRSRWTLQSEKELAMPAPIAMQMENPKVMTLSTASSLRILL